jgi:outer membrane immunogenic protein
MKKFLLGTVGLVAMSMAAPASAADVAARPYTPPAPVAVIYNWTGFYIGVNGGGGSAHNCWDLVNDSLGDLPGSEGCHNATGGTAGGQIGYRWQTSNNWVWGIEGQGNWADFRGSNVSNLFAPDFNRSRIDAFGLITGQVGYAWNNVLFYVKGGGAVTGNKNDAFDGVFGVLLASANETRWGGTAGAGLEFGFAPNWSLGFEYDHLFMGSRNVALTGPILSETEHISQDVDIGLVRLNYRFGPFGGLLGATHY